MSSPKERYYAHQAKEGKISQSDAKKMAAPPKPTYVSRLSTVHQAANQDRAVRNPQQAQNPQDKLNTLKSYMQGFSQSVNNLGQAFVQDSATAVRQMSTGQTPNDLRTIRRQVNKSTASPNEKLMANKQIQRAIQQKKTQANAPKPNIPDNWGELQPVADMVKGRQQQAKEQAKLPIGQRIVAGLKTGIDPFGLAKGAAQWIPGATATALVSFGKALNQAMGKRLMPEEYTPETGIEKAIVGDQPIKPVQSGDTGVGSSVAKYISQKANLGKSGILLGAAGSIGDIFLNYSLGGAEEKNIAEAIAKSTSQSQILKILARAVKGLKGNEARAAAKDLVDITKPAEVASYLKDLKTSRVKSAAVKVGDKTYEGVSHAEATKTAQKAGEDITIAEGKGAKAGFVMKDGTFKTREEMGGIQSHEVPQLKAKQPLQEGGQGTMYRGASQAEWKSIQETGKFQEKSGSRLIDKSTGKEITYGAEEGINTTPEKKLATLYGHGVGQDGVVIEFKPEAKAKMRFSNKFDSTDLKADEYLGKDMTIDDVAKVTDKNGKILYESSQPLQEGGAKKAEVKSFLPKSPKEVRMEAQNRRLQYIADAKKAKAQEGLTLQDVRPSDKIPKPTDNLPADKIIEGAKFKDKGKGQGLYSAIRKLVNPTYGMDDVSSELASAKKLFKDGEITKAEYKQQLKDISKQRDLLTQKGKDVKTLLRQGTGKFNYESRITVSNSEALSRQWEKVDKTDQLKFISSIEQGKPIKGTEDLYNKYVKQAADDFKIQQSIKEDAPWRKNYFTHSGLWADPKEADAFYSKWAKEHFGGNKAFFKKRTEPTILDGINAGLKINEDINVEKLAANKHINVLKAKMADDFLKQAVKEGIPDSMAQAMIENHMERGFEDSPIYQKVRSANFVMNLYQLGLSAFHLSTTTSLSVASRISQGIEELTRGQFLKAGGSFLKTPISPALDLATGWKPFFGALKEDVSPAVKRSIELITGGGGTARRPHQYDTGWFGDMMKNFRKAEFSGKGVAGVAKGVAEVPFAIMQKISEPLMGYIVPMMKDGVSIRMAESKLAAAGEDISQPETRRILSEVTDVVDNTFGELQQDNLFWNKHMKDILNGFTRSLGWSGGEIRLFAGGIKDLANPIQLLKDIKAGKGISSAAAMTIATPITTALIATVYMKAHGLNPTGIADYVFPRTGQKTKTGQDERVGIPGYMKDVYAYSKNWAQTLTNKESPIVGMMNGFSQYELTGGIKDYYGNWAVDPNATKTQQATQMMGYIGSFFTPFSISGQSNRAAKSVETGVESFFGFNPAPASVVKGSANDLSKMWATMIPKVPLSPQDAAALQTKLNNSTPKTPLTDDQTKAQIDFLKKLNQTTEGTPERTKLIQDYMINIPADQRGTINYKLQLAGISTKGVKMSDNTISAQQLADKLVAGDKAGAKQMLEDIAKNNPDSADKIAGYALNDVKESYMSPQELKIKNGKLADRAQAALDLINSQPDKASKLKVLDELDSKGLVTDNLVKEIANQTQAGYKPKTVSDTQVGQKQPTTPPSKDETSIIGKVLTYVKAIGTDPLTAFHDIFAGQTIKRLDNGAIIVDRMSEQDSSKAKSEMGGSTEMTLDHTIPLELGGTNEKSNLRLVPKDQASQADDVENYLGNQLRSKKMTKDQVQKVIKDFKDGTITKEQAMSGQVSDAGTMPDWVKGLFGETAQAAEKPAETSKFTDKPVSLKADNRNMRTDRNNNPIAAAVSMGRENQFTRALDDAGITWDYGDAFGNNPNMATIQIQGDALAGADAILANTNALQGWYLRHTGRTVMEDFGIKNNEDYKKLSDEDKVAVIYGIYQAEGGSGQFNQG